MRAMVFEGVGRPLRLVERGRPAAQAGELLLRVEACGICRTDLHLLDGEVPLERAGDALDDLRAGRLTGAGVIVP